DAGIAAALVVGSLAAVSVLAPGKHLSPDTAVMTAGVRSCWVPENHQLHEADRREVPEPRETESADRPNILLIVNESLGTHELELTGDRVDQMPYLQKWIRRAPSQFVRFRHAYANSTSTDLSVPSMLTGVGPYRPVDHLHEMPLIWDWARAAGLSPFYVSAQNYSATNFPEFFFEDDPMPIFTPNSLEGRSGDDFALDELVAAEKFDEMLSDVPEDRPFFAVYNSNAMHKPFQQRSRLLDQQPRRGTPYRNAMYVLDRALKRIIESIRREGRLEDTIVIMTSDHGEYVDRRHKVPRILSLYEEFIRVPMLMRIPEKWRNRRAEAVAGLETNRERNVTNLDIVPTVVDILGYDRVEAAAPLRDKLSGHSLLEPVPPGRTIIAINNNAIRHWEHQGFGIFWKDWRFVFTDIEGPRLFDIAEDPHQKNDLWEQAPAPVRNHVLETIRDNKFLDEMWTSYQTGTKRPRAAE
ncbi:MAG: sulfatase, partial [Bradymonadaceae bacterium]